MKAEAHAVIAAGGRLVRVTGRPPLTLRRLYSSAADCAIGLVGSAAGPLPGDELTLRLDVGAAAHGSLVAAGAMIAQGVKTDADAPARVDALVSVADSGVLDADPGPLIVCAGADVVTTVSLDLADSASIRWRETVVLGRHGEPGGSVRLVWNVRRGGRPLLRQSVDLSEESLRRWPGMVAGAKVLYAELRVGPAFGPYGGGAAIVHSARAVTQPIADDASLRTVLADSATDPLLAGG